MLLALQDIIQSNGAIIDLLISLIENLGIQLKNFQKEKKNVFNLVGYKDSHFGIFDHIVPLKEHESKFEHLKMSNPNIKAYWKRIHDEIEERIAYGKELAIRIEEEKKVYQELKEQIGYKPKRIYKLTKVLQNPKNERLSTLLKEMIENPVLKRQVEKDIAYRIESVNMYKLIDKDNRFRDKFYVSLDVRKIKKLNEIKEQIDNFDFTLESLKKLEMKERFENNEATVMDIISSKTSQLKESVKKATKRRSLK